MNNIPENLGFSGMCQKFNAPTVPSATNPHAAHLPAIAVPEPLLLPVARPHGAAIGRPIIGGAAIIVAGAIGVGAVGDRATDDGAANDPRRDTRSPPTPPSLRRGGGGNCQGGNRRKCHQRLLHDVTFLDLPNAKPRKIIPS